MSTEDRNVATQHVRACLEATLETGNQCFLAPEIPEKKLSTARRVFGKHSENETIIALLDNTVFGSCKDGCLLADQAIYWRSSMVDKPDSIHYADIDPESIHVDPKRKSVSIGEKTITISVVEELQRNQLAAFLRKLAGGDYQSRLSGESRDDTEVPSQDSDVSLVAKNTSGPKHGLDTDRSESESEDSTNTNREDQLSTTDPSSELEEAGDSLIAEDSAGSDSVIKDIGAGLLVSLTPFGFTKKGRKLAKKTASNLAKRAGWREGACQQCGQQLGSFSLGGVSQHHLLPDDVLDDERPICLDCIQKIDITCQNCGEVWHIDPKLAVCPRCTPLPDLGIEEVHDEFRRTTTYRILLSRSAFLKSLLGFSVSHRLELRKVVDHGRNISFYMVDAILSHKSDQQAYLGIRALFLRCGEYVVDLPLTRQWQDSNTSVQSHIEEKDAPKSLDDVMANRDSGKVLVERQTTTCEILEGAHFQISAEELLTLVDPGSDILVRVGTEQTDIDFEIGMSDVGRQLSLFVERLGTREEAEAVDSKYDATEMDEDLIIPEDKDGIDFGDTEPTPTKGSAEEPVEGSQGSGHPSSQLSPVDALKQLKELLDAGILTSDEFDAKKAELLERM